MKAEGGYRTTFVSICFVITKKHRRPAGPRSSCMCKDTTAKPFQIACHPGGNALSGASFAGCALSGASTLGQTPVTIALSVVASATSHSRRQSSRFVGDSVVVVPKSFWCLRSIPNNHHASPCASGQNFLCVSLSAREPLHCSSSGVQPAMPSYVFSLSSACCQKQCIIRCAILLPPSYAHLMCISLRLAEVNPVGMQDTPATSINAAHHNHVNRLPECHPWYTETS